MVTLLRNNQKLIWYWVRHYARACWGLAVVDVDDLFQSGFLGVVEAQNSYDPDKGSWGTWASYFIRKKMLEEMGFRNANRRKLDWALSLHSPAYPSDDECNVALLDTIEDTTLPNMEETVEAYDTARIVREAVEKLESPEVRQTISEYYFAGKTMRQIAETQGETVSTVRKLHGQGLRSLRKARNVRSLFDSWMDRETCFHAHKGVAAFWNTHSSVVEDAVIMRERLLGEKYGNAPCEP